MMRVYAMLTVMIVSIGVAPRISAGRGDDPFVGTWTLDRGHSHYAKEAPPDEMSIVIESAPNGLVYRSNTRHAEGRTSGSLFTASFDGTPTLVIGSSGFLAPVSLHRLDDTTIEATYTSGPRPVAWSRWSLDADAMQLVVSTTFLDAQGEKVLNIAAFHRVTS